MYMYKATEKLYCVRAEKSKPKALRHFKVDSFFKIDETFFKHAESMWQFYGLFSVYIALNELNVILL